MARRRHVGFVCSDYQSDDFFLCVETDVQESLEMRDLRQGAYVVFELHTDENGFWHARKVRLALEDEIAANVTRFERSYNFIKRPRASAHPALGLEAQERRHLPPKLA